MKSILTLNTSSMYFVGEVNLYKGVPSEFDSEDMSKSTIKMVNNAIANGTILSSEGLFVVGDTSKVTEEVVQETDKVAEVESKEPTIEDAKELVVETEVKPEVKLEVKPVAKAPVKRSTVKKPVAVKETK